MLWALCPLGHLISKVLGFSRARLQRSSNISIELPAKNCVFLNDCSSVGGKISRKEKVNSAQKQKELSQVGEPRRARVKVVNSDVRPQAGAQGTHLPRATQPLGAVRQSLDDFGAGQAQALG